MDDEQHRAAGGPAYPTSGYANGMSLRDHFAACALTGYLAAFTGGRPFPGPEAVAIECYAYADAMLAERRHRRGAEGV